MSRGFLGRRNSVNTARDFGYDHDRYVYFDIIYHRHGQKEGLDRHAKEGPDKFLSGNVDP